MNHRPSPAARAAVAVAIGIACGVYFYGSVDPTRPGDDFTFYWLGARALIEGKDPYVVIQPGGPYNLDAPLLSPLTTAMIAVPFALWLSPAMGAAVVVGVGAALLAWAVTQESFARLPIFGSAPFFWSVTSGQMSPLLTAGALMPALAWVWPAKPNIGLATLVYRPSKWALVGSGLFILASLVINPHWPAEWLAALGTRSQAEYGKGIPLMLTGGPLLLLALARWRRPEARLLLVMACVPQTLLFYDQLPLWLIARTRLQSAAMGLISMLGLIVAGFALPSSPTISQAADTFWPMIFATCYLPALALVMREPNVGSAPAWLERIVRKARPDISVTS